MNKKLGLLITLVAAFCVALPLSVIAGLRVTEKSEGHQLLVGSVVNKYPTHDACVAAAKAAGVGVYKCKDVTSVTIEATCEDVPRPELKAVLDADGVLVLPELKVEAIANGEWGPTEEQGFVSAPYPACWTLGWVPYTGTWASPEGPPSADEGPWVYGVDYPAGTACPKEAHAGCYIPPHPEVPAP